MKRIAACVRPYLPPPQSASSTAITASHYVFLISGAGTTAGSNVRLALPNVTVTTRADRTQQDARQLAAQSIATVSCMRGVKTAQLHSSRCAAKGTDRWAVCTCVVGVRCAHVLWVCGSYLLRLETVVKHVRAKSA
jgi:hypothetical protein